MGYPAEISGADSDPVMQAIRAKFAQQATGAPTQMLPEQVRAAAQAAVLARNGNAKASALNSQMQAMHADPAVMQMIMETYGPDMAAQYAGGGNGAVQQPQAIQRAIPSAAETPIAEAAEGISSSPEEEVMEANGAVGAGVPLGQPAIPPVAQGAAPAGIDPALAAALGIGGAAAGGAAAGGAAGYALAKRGQPAAIPPTAAPNMRQAVPGDLNAQMPPPAAKMAPPVDPKMQAAVMGTPDAPSPPPVKQRVMPRSVSDGMSEDDILSLRAQDEMYAEQRAFDEDPDDSYGKAVASGEIDEVGIPEHMRSNVDDRSRPTIKRTQRMAKDADADGSHMRSIIMEGQGGNEPEPFNDAKQAQTVEAPAQAQEANAGGKRKPKKAKDAAAAEGEAPKKRGRKASATPNVDGGTDYVHRDTKTAKEAIKASKAKAAEAVPAAAEETLASKVDKVAAEATEAEKPKTKRGPKARKTDKAAKKTEAAAPVDDRLPEGPKPELRKSRLDTPTGPGAKANAGMTLVEAKEIIKSEPDWDVIERLKAGDMGKVEFEALQEKARGMIRASKGASAGNPKKAKTAANADAVMKESKDNRTAYTYDDDTGRTVMKAIKEPVVVRRPQRKQDANASALAQALARRKAR